MFESGYYPAGAEHDPRAPYNQAEPEAQDIEVDVLVSIAKKVTISSTEYEGGYYDKVEGYYEPVKYTGVAVNDYKEQCMSVTDMLADYCKMLEKEQHRLEEWIRLGILGKRKHQAILQELKHKIECAKGWELSDIDAYQI